MKKALVVAVLFLLIFSLTGCGLLRSLVEDKVDDIVNDLPDNPLDGNNQGNGSGDAEGPNVSANEVWAELTWNTDADLDLEIWSGEEEYLYDSYDLMNYPDVASGHEGSEWFAFRNIPDYDDFTTGQWILSAYFWEVGPSGEDTADVTLTLHTPDGNVETFTKELRYEAPYDQWMTLLIDFDNDEWKLLDYFWE